MQLRGAIASLLGAGVSDAVDIRDLGGFDFVRVLQQVEGSEALRRDPRADPRVKELRRCGYTRDGVLAVLEFGLERGIADPIEASRAYEEENPPPTTVAKGGGRWDFLYVPQESQKLPDTTALFQSQGNDDRWLAQSVAQTLSQIRQGHVEVAQFDHAYRGYEFAAAK
jgi:hypothetical protein